MHRSLLLVPSVFSGLRLLCALALPIAPREWWLALVLGAAASDWLDGFAARRLRAATWLGGLFDSIVDKVFVLSALLTYASAGVVAWWQVPFLLVRDLCVAAGALVSVLRGDGRAFREMDSRPLGKLATVVLFVLFAALLVWPEIGPVHGFFYTFGVLASTAAGVDYALIRFPGLGRSR